MGHHIVNLVGDIVTIWIGMQYYSTFGEKQPYKRSTDALILFGCLSVSMIGSTFVLYNSAFVMPVQVLAMLILSLLYKYKWYMRMLYALIYYLLLGLSELVVGMVFNVLFEHFLEARENALVYLICALTARLISFFVVKIVKLLTRKHFAIDIKSVIFILPLPVVTFLQLFIFIKVYYYIVDTEYSALMALFCIFMILANISVFVFVDRMNDYTEKKTELMLYEKEYESQKQHLQSVQEHLNETGKFRHDAKNELLVLIGLMKSGEYEKALSQMNRSLGILDERECNIINSNNLIIDSLLQHKIKEQEKEGIYIKPIIKLSEPLTVNEVDMGILLGNIVDNAIEATEKLNPEKRVPIEVRIISLDGIVSINVTNAVEHEVDTQKLYTIKKDKLMHGHGINQIKKTVALYDGTAEFICENNIFTVRTAMNNQPRSN